MNKKYTGLDEMFNVNQGAVEDFFRIQTHAWENLTKLQSDFASLWLECLNAQIQRISSAKSMNDICATEAGLATEYSMKFSDNIRKVYETLLNSQKEFMACCSPEAMLVQTKPHKPEKTEKGRALEAGQDMPRSETAS